MTGNTHSIRFILPISLVLVLFVGSVAQAAQREDLSADSEQAKRVVLQRVQ